MAPPSPAAGCQRRLLRLLLVAGALTHVVTGNGGVTIDVTARRERELMQMAGSDASGSNASDLALRTKKSETPSSSSGVGTRSVSDSDAKGGGQRYDLVAAVSAVAVVIIAALLFVLHRSRKRTREDRDVYKSTSEDEPHHPNQHAHRDGGNESTNSVSSTWKVGSTNTRTLPRPSSPSLTLSVNDGDPTSSSDTETLNAIWRDPVIAAARLPFEEIHLRSLMCRGAFGEVFDGMYDGKKVAVKRLLPERRQNIESLECFMLEVRMMASLNHPRVVTFIGVAWDAMKDLCIVSELMEHGDLRKVIQKWKQKGKSTEWNATKLKIALHVAEALQYLHTLSPKKIIHRDLKSRNVLVDEKWDAKLSDFGVSRERSAHMTRTLTANVGSSLWMAPEIMLGENYDEKADIFSFGVVLTELDTHLLPYHNVTTPDGRHLPEPAILHMVVIGSVQAEFLGTSQADVVALGRQCLSLDPVARPSASELVHRLQTMLTEAATTAVQEQQRFVE
ncbi:Tkl protein kinase [Globisporangium polare]